MKKPYMHLNLPMVRGITKNPQDCFENFDIDKRMLFRDAGCTLLSSDVHNWFRDKFKIFPFLGLLWSWPQWSESDEIYHVDFYGKDGELDASSQYTFAMNLLIQGEPSATEFSNLEDSVQIPPQPVHIKVSSAFVHKLCTRLQPSMLGLLEFIERMPIAPVTLRSLESVG